MLWVPEPAKGFTVIYDAPWRSPAHKVLGILHIKGAEEITSVTLKTQRSDAGIAYEVWVTRQGRSEICVWHKRVLFGNDPNHRAGGRAFQAAAFEQERAAKRVWECRDQARSEAS